MSKSVGSMDLPRPLWSACHSEMWMVIDNGKVKIRLGTVYAPQESRTKKAEYKKLYQRIEEQLELAREKGQKVMVIGDFNGKIGDWITGNKPEVSKSGKLLQKLINLFNQNLGGQFAPD